MAWDDTAFAIAWWLPALVVVATVVRERWVDIDARVLLPGATAVAVYALHQATAWSTWLQIAGLLLVVWMGAWGGRLLCYAVPPLEGWIWPVWALWHAVVDSWLLVLAVAFADNRDWDTADPRNASPAVWGAWVATGLVLFLWSLVWHVKRMRERDHNYESVQDA